VLSGRLMLREMMTRYGRHNIGFLWLFVEPMLFTLGVTALWTATQSAHGSSCRSWPSRSPAILVSCCGGTCRAGASARSRLILSLLYHRNVRPLTSMPRDCCSKRPAQRCRSFFWRSFFVLSDGWRCLKTFCRLQWLDYAGLVRGQLALLFGALSEASETIEKLWHPVATYLLSRFLARRSSSMRFRRGGGMSSVAAHGARRRIPS
jgi:capsular polysaccharide transport system permease protein